MAELVREYTAVSPNTIRSLEDATKADYADESTMSKIDARLTSLGHQIDTLDTAIGNLIGRLRPVLGPPKTGRGSDEPDRDSRESSLVARVLLDMWEKVAEMSRTIDYLTEDIEL